MWIINHLCSGIILFQKIVHIFFLILYSFQFFINIYVYFSEKAGKPKVKQKIKNESEVEEKNESLDPETINEIFITQEQVDSILDVVINDTIINIEE